MATYNPPAFPRRPKQYSLFSELRYQLQLTHYRYEINTALYVMSPGEKLAYNVIFISFLVLLLSATYYYLPSAVYVSIQRLAYYITGSSKVDMPGIPAAEVLQRSGEAARSLAEAVTTNPSSVFAH